MANEIVTCVWKLEITFHATIGDQQRLAIKRIKETAANLEGMPPTVIEELIRESGGQPTGGICGAPYDFKKTAVTDDWIASGWKCLWSVQVKTE
jgi:hypothetical protein